ncbi:unnamed protein product [Rhizopus stolonifer]
MSKSGAFTAKHMMGVICVIYLKFLFGSSPLMVTIDIAARGLDIPGVEYVVSLTFPLSIEAYVHLIGRTGCGGKKGTAYTFFTPEDKAHSGELINVLK